MEREIGRGAMGVIYKAEDPDIGRTVAIKLVRADLLQGEDREDFLARFRHEARAAGRCAHPNIVALYDFAMHDGNPFLAMEYIDGVGLGQALKRVGRFPPAGAVDIMLQVLDALGAAHGLGIVHRDVKPANILLQPNGQVKVTDFGISRIDTSNITQDGTMIGTPAYMSPEQCRGETVDPRSDLFSAGTVLYELLSGTRAFDGKSATDVTYQLLTVNPKDLTELVAEVPEDLAAVLRKAMEKPRDARYASAQAMADALRAVTRNVAFPSDRTVMIAAPSAFEPGPREEFDDATLSTIERRLTQHIGPIARHLVRDAARKTHSIETLCESLASRIALESERRRFLTDILDSPARRTGTAAARSVTQQPAVPSVGTPSRAPLSAGQIERAERALTAYLGPIARVLVKRALPGTESETALWERLSAHIEGTADRAAFLRQRSKA